MRWSDVVAHVAPWKSKHGDDDAARLADTVTVQQEQQQLSGTIADQTERLVKAGQINGFTEQLRLGFQRRLAGD